MVELRILHVEIMGLQTETVSFVALSWWLAGLELFFTVVSVDLCYDFYKMPSH